MKRLRYLALFAAILGSFVFASATAAAPKQTTVGTLLGGLITVNVSNVNVEVIDVVDVSDVLNDANIEILNNVLNNSPIASNNSEILTNLLREANLITDNQIVVGVLGGTFFVTDLAQ
jgi:hypothetical protein